MSTEKEKPNPYNVQYDHYMDTNACTECTGLMPTPADSREEWDTYHDIFRFYPTGRPKDIP